MAEKKRNKQEKLQRQPKASRKLSPGDPNDQDVERRIGNFQGAGEPSRKGGREGIGGQSPKKFRTDNKSN